ncbi:hypothetical protein [Mycoplasma enhydrae]|uniref:hypothetical protein n=1 Tax=Mycoplasma enhydrae TaxID=2499220 RepID=UPI00197B277C|nr:hypothetical protein [Mycoplasma enhydrae]MBN4089520.1 hypothetical protein [Mycoplasma enhydrae]MCV3733635.1 hypothetical protein [Mycoplasma enhydrae]
MTNINKELKNNLKTVRKNSIREIEFLIDLAKKYKLNSIDELKVYIQSRKGGNHFTSKELKKIINRITNIENLKTPNKKSLDLDKEFEEIIKKNWGDWND